MKTKLFRKNNLPLLGRGLGGGLLLLLFPLALSAQNGVTVSGLMVTDGSPASVTFHVSWTDDYAPGFVWSDSVWVFVDYNVEGKMERLPLLPGATLTATSAPGVGKVMPGNDKGVWVVGNARNMGSFSATVQLLTATATATGMCAYASNYPPVGEYTAANKIKFTGTPEYDIVLKHSGGATETLQSGKTFLVPDGYTLQSFTDKTGAPGIIKCITPSAYTLLASASSFCAGNATGVVFSLSGTEIGRKYRLYRGDTPVGAELPGTGSAASFGLFNVAGVYAARTVADGSYCEVAMTGSHNITSTALPAAPSSPSSNKRCGSGTVTFSASVPGGITIDWYNAVTGGSTVTGGYNTTSFSPSLGQTTTYYAQARNTTTTCVSAARTAVVATINPVPTIERTGGAASQSVYQGTAISPITYTASNATNIGSSGSFPTGVSGIPNGTVFTISGTPSATGTYDYAVTASHTNGCTSSASTGAITVTAAVATPPGAASTQTWVIGTQTWSAPLKTAPSGCSASTDFGTTNPPTTAMYRTSGLYTGSGYLYNWKCVNDYATSLCPTPWRVPTKDDFCDLDKALFGAESCVIPSAESLPAVYDVISRLYGPIVGGYVYGDLLYYPDSLSAYWSITPSSTETAYSLYVFTGGAYVPQFSYYKRTGFQLRCVR